MSPSTGGQPYYTGLYLIHRFAIVILRALGLRPQRQYRARPIQPQERRNIPLYEKRLWQLSKRLEASRPGRMTN